MKLKKEKLYKITKSIKLHTKPLVTERIEKIGKFQKETKNYLVFDTFKVQKKCILYVEEFNSNCNYFIGMADFDKEE